MRNCIPQSPSLLVAAASRTGIPAALCALGLGVGLFSHLAGLSPWTVGLWEGSEPITLAVHLGAGLCAFGLALAVIRGCIASVWADLTHPFVLLPLALGVWSVAGGVIMAIDPALALLGAPQTGEGPLLWLDQGLLVAAALWVRRSSLVLSVTVAWAALAAATVLPLLILFSATQVYFFGAWHVYLVIAAPVVACSFVRDRDGPPVGRRGGRPDGRRGGRPDGRQLGRWASRHWPALAASVAVLSGLATSGSLTAVGVGVFCLPVLIRLWAPEATSHLAGWCCRSPVAAAGPGLFVLLVPVMVIAVAAGCWACGQSKALESIWSRVHLQQALLADLWEVGPPWVWALGRGWGHVSEMFSRSVMAAGIPIWSGPTNWDMLGRDIVNSHNFALEALLAAGLPGLLLKVAGVAAWPWFARKGEVWVAGLFALSFVLLGSLWFQVPGTVVIVALAGAMVAAVRPVASPSCFRFRAGVAPLIGLALAGLGLGLGTVSWRLLDEGRVTARAAAGWLASAPPIQAVACDASAVSGWRGDAYVGEVLVRLIKSLRRAPESVNEARLFALRTVICLAERPRYRASPRVQASLLAAYGDLMFVPGFAKGQYAPMFAGAPERWDALVMNFLAIAPGRGDLVAPYLRWLLREGKPEPLLAAADRILRVAPGEPVTLWYSGSVLTHAADPRDREAGFDRLRQALAAGVELRILIDDTTRRFVLSRSTDSPATGAGGALAPDGRGAP